jgi:hypothetical protein
MVSPANIRPRRFGFAKDQQSSWFGLFVIDQEKSFIKFPTGVNVIKLFSFIVDDKAK